MKAYKNVHLGHLVLIGILVAPLVNSGCGTNTENSGGAVGGIGGGTPPPLAQINGTFVSGCANEATSYSSRNTLEVAPTLYSLNAAVYPRLNCTANPSLEIRTVTTRASTNEVFGEGNKVDLAVVSITMRVNDVAVRDAYNQIAFCGISNWEIGVGRDITGLRCEPTTMPAKDSKILAIEKIEGRTIRLGLPDGEDMSQRPDKLDPEIYTQTP